MNARPQDLNQRLIQKIITSSHPLDPKPTSAAPKLQPLAGIKAALFDVYGTMLVSASGDIGSAPVCQRETHLQTALQSAGFTHLASMTSSCGIRWLDQFINEDQETLRREGIEHPEVNILEIWKRTLGELARKGLIHGSMSDEAVACVAVDYECRVNPVWPMPYLRETLDHWVSSGRKLGIVSNAQFYTPLTLRAFPQTGWKDGLFDEGPCGWSYTFREAKPSTKLLQFALQQLAVRHGIQAPEVLCVGNDRLNDILPAAQMGCKTALFAGDRRSYRPRVSDPAIMGVTPDVVIVELRQICEVAP
jgi:putative hydrolase of the HAD superfamily